MNKNVSVWRGVVSPPTHTHIWVKDDKSVYIYEDRQWVPLFDEATTEISGLMSASDKLIIKTLNKNLRWN